MKVYFCKVTLALTHLSMSQHSQKDNKLHHVGQQYQGKKIDDTAKGGLTIFWGLFYRDSLRSQRFKTLFERIWVSNWNFGLFKHRRSYLMIFGSKH